MAETLPLRLKSLEEDDDPWIVELSMFTILKDYLQPESSISKAEAADAIDDLTPMKRKARGEDVEHPESYVLETWGIFIEVVKQIPSDHQSQAKMVHLMQHLTTLPSHEVEIWSTKTRIWADLPLLAASVREAWIEPDNRDDTYEPFDQWVNFQAFAARLLEARLAKWFHFAVWTMRDALEEDPGSSKDVWEYRVRAAAQWIEHARKVLFKNLDTSELPEDQQRQMVNGPLYSGQNGLSLERWKFWTTGFRRIGERDDISAATKSLSLRTAEEMEAMAAMQTSESTAPVSASEST